MHHFPFHIGDFGKDTARLSLTEVGAYVRLLMEYYDGEKPLCNDHNELAYTVGARTAAETAALNHVLKRFFKLDPEENHYSQKRCEEVISDYRQSGIQSRYANLCRHWDKVNKGLPKPDFATFANSPDSYFEPDTGRVRKVTARNSLVLVSESPDSPALPLPQSQPITNNQEPITIETPIVPKGTKQSGFPTDDSIANAIYAAYPRKVGKAAALKRIKEALKVSGLTEMEMQKRVKMFADGIHQRLANDPSFTLDLCPHPATWFHQGRYEDDPAEWTRHATGPSSPQKKERGGGGFFESEVSPRAEIEHPAPEGYQAAWAEMFDITCPPWAGMMPEHQQRIRQKLDLKKEGGPDHA